MFPQQAKNKNLYVKFSSKKEKTRRKEIILRVYGSNLITDESKRKKLIK